MLLKIIWLYRKFGIRFLSLCLSLTFLFDAYTTSADKTTFNPGYQKDMMKKNINEHYEEISKMPINVKETNRRK